MAKAPKLPAFMDDKDELDSYLERFERYAKIQKWDISTWAIALSALLSGKALDVYTRMNSNDAIDYAKVKAALLKRYNLTEDGFRLKFRTSRPEPDENPGQFITRLGSYVDRWIETASANSFDLLRRLIIREQFINMCPKRLAVYLKEQQLRIWMEWQRRLKDS